MKLIQHHISKSIYYVIIFILGFVFGFISAIVFWNVPVDKAASMSAYYGLVAVVTTIAGVELGRRTKKK